MALTVHDGPVAVVPVIAEPARRRRGRLTMLLILLACLAPVAVSYLLYFVVRPSDRANYADLVQPTRGIPSGLTLATLDGKPIDALSLKGQWLLVVVSGGSCDAACEGHLYQQRQLREMMGRERDRMDRVWLVVDQVGVRPEIAAAMAHGEPAVVLRAPRDQVAAWLAPESGHSLEDHLYLVDPMGEWMMRAPAPFDPMKFKRDLDRLLRASAFWDRPGREP